MTTALAAQTRTEVVLTLRRGESLLLVLGIPVLLLVFFAGVDVVDTGGLDRIDFVAPGILALAVMSTAMVSLGIATGFERTYGVLKRLGATPLGRPRLVVAKIASVVLVELLQLVVLVPVALALGWDPELGSAPAVVAAVALGTTAFAGLGLTLAGTLRGEVNLAALNGLYLVLLLLGGMVVPVERLPDALEGLTAVLPSTALAQVLRDAVTGAPADTTAWLVLLVWAVVTPVAAARLFRWE